MDAQTNFLQPLKIIVMVLGAWALQTNAQNTVAPQQLPSGAKVVGGNASLNASGNSLQVNQSTTRAAIEWNSFNVGSDARVQFNQPSSSSVTLNRVVGGDPSQIMGRINAPGQVFISNPSGVIFGPKAQVDVGGLLVTTLGISNDDFMAGKTSFSGSGSNAKVINQGALQAALGGFVALLAPEVRNEGIIVAHQGAVALAAGNKATLVFSGTSLTTVEVEQGIINALVENKHMLMADGGLVLMTARSANALLGSLVKNSGTVQAQTIANRNGRILLLGDMTSGTTQVDGKLDASAPAGGNGGFVETSAARVTIGPQASVTTQSAQGKYGHWLVDPVDFTVADTGGDMTGTTLQNNLNTSHVTLMSAAGATNGLGDVNINSSINWSANTTLTLTASNNVNINANMTATGNTAGLVISPNTTHVFGSVTQTASGTGKFNLLFGKSIKLSGTAPTLSIAGQIYTIINQANLQYTADNFVPAGLYALVQDVDASSYPLSNFKGLAGGATFTGRFEGLGNHISNLTINTFAPSSGLNLGLFAVIGTTGVVSNLGLLNGVVTSLGSAEALGTLAGVNQGLILKSYSGLNISAGTGAKAVGGLVGINQGTIQNSFAKGSLTGGDGILAMGGLSGISTGTIRESFAMGNLSVGSSAGGVGTASLGIGGLVGYAQGLAIGVYANGSVTASTNARGLGGLIGYAQGLTLNKSYATGSLTMSGSAQNVGGLIGETYNTSVQNSYATGGIQVSGSGTDVGNFVGLHRNNSISQSYATGSVTLGTGTTQGFYGGNNSAGVFTNNFWNTTSSGIASNPSKSGITGLNGAQMQTFSTFLNAGWDNTVWVQISGQNNDFPVMGIGHSALYAKANTGSSIYGTTPNLTYQVFNLPQAIPNPNSITPFLEPIEAIGYSLTGTPAWKITQGAAAVPGTTLTGLNGAGTYNLGYAAGLSWTKGNIPIHPAAPNNWVIQPKTLTASIATGTSVYGDLLVPGLVTLSGLVNNDAISTSAVTINTTNLLSPSGKLKAGNHLGIQSVSNVLSGTGSSNYTFAGATGNYSVTPKALSGSITASSSVYGLALTPGTASVTGLLPSDVVTLGPVVVNVVGLPKSTSGYLKVGLYPAIQSLTIGNTDGGNYTFGGTVGDYRVTAKPLVGSITNSSSIYGAPLVPGTASITSGWITGDAVTPGTVTVNATGNTSSSGQLKAGTYTNATIQTATLNGADASNYSFSANSTYTVTPLALAGVIGAGSSVYGASLIPGTVSFTNKIAGDVVLPGAVSINTAGNTSSSGKLKAGTYTNIQSVSSISGDDANNYTFSPVTGEYTVTKKTLSGTIADSSSVYGTPLVAGSASISSGVVGTDAVNVSGVAVQTTGNESVTGKLKVGTYTQSNLQTATLGGADASNYSFAANSTYSVTLNSAAIAGMTAAELQELTPAQLRALSNAELLSISQSNFAALRPLQIGGLSQSQLVALPSSNIQSLTPAQISALSSQQIGYLQPAQMAQFSGTQVSALTSAQLQALTSAQINALPAASFSQLSADQLGALTPSQVGSLSPLFIKNLSAQQLAGLNANQLASLSLVQLEQISPTQLSTLTESQIKGLTPVQLKNLTNTQRLAFSNSQLKTLNRSQVEALATNILEKPLSADARNSNDRQTSNRLSNVISYLDPNASNLKPDQYGKIEVPVSNQLNTADLKGVQHLNASQVAELPADRLSSVSLSQLKSLSTNQLANLNAEQLKALSSGQLSALSTSQMAAFSDSQLKSLTPTQWRALTDPQMAALSPTQISAIPKEAVGQLKESQLQALTNEQMGFLGSETIQAMNKSQLGCFTCSQIRSLSPQILAMLRPNVFKELAQKKWGCMSAKQINALSPDQLQTWQRTQPQDFSLDQVQALSPSQLTTLSAVTLQKWPQEIAQSLLPEQIAVLAPDQMRPLLKHLSPLQLAALNDRQMTNLTPSDIKQLQPVQWQALTPTQIPQLPTDTLLGLNKSQWRDLKPEQIAALTPAQFKSLSGDALAELKPEQMQALQKDQLASLSPSQIKAFTPKQQQVLSADQVSSLQPEQRDAFANPPLIAKPKTPSDNTLDKAFQQVPAEQLTPSQLALLTPDQIRLLTPAQMKGLSAGQLAGLSANQWPLINPEQLNAIAPEAWRNLDPSAFKNLSPQQWAQLSPAAWQAMNPNALENMPIAAVASLKPEVFKSLNPAKLNALSKPQWGAVNPSQVKALTPAQVAALNPAQMQKWNASQLTTLTPEQLNALTDAQWKNLTPEQVKQLQPSQLSSLGNKAIQAFSPEQIQSWTSPQLVALSPNQLAALKGSQLQGLAENQMAVLTPSQLAAWSPEQFQVLSPLQITAITPVFFNRINPVILQTMSVAQITALTPQDIAAMGSPQIQSFTIVWMANLSPSQLSGLLPHQIQMFSPIQLRAFPNRTLWSLSNQQLQSLTPEQISQFNPAQINPLISLFTPQQLMGLQQKQFATVTNPIEQGGAALNRPMRDRNMPQPNLNR